MTFQFSYVCYPSRFSSFSNKGVREEEEAAGLNENFQSPILNGQVSKLYANPLISQIIIAIKDRDLREKAKQKKKTFNLSEINSDAGNLGSIFSVVLIVVCKLRCIGDHCRSSVTNQIKIIRLPLVFSKLSSQIILIRKANRTLFYFERP